jgi:CBS domain-containing protein
VPIGTLVGPEVVRGEITESLRTLATRMRAHGIGSLPIFGGERLLGIPTERDLVAVVADGVVAPAVAAAHPTLGPVAADPSGDTATAAERRLWGFPPAGGGARMTRGHGLGARPAGAGGPVEPGPGAASGVSRPAAFGRRSADGQVPDHVPGRAATVATLRCRTTLPETVRGGSAGRGRTARAAEDVRDPGPKATDRSTLERVSRLIREGPPAERVGLEPFAPPEVVPVPGVGTRP